VVEKEARKSRNAGQELKTRSGQAVRSSVVPVDRFGQPRESEGEVPALQGGLEGALDVAAKVKDRATCLVRLVARAFGSGSPAFTPEIALGEGLTTQEWRVVLRLDEEQGGQSQTGRDGRPAPDIVNGSVTKGLQ
jgi:hypothetical protein